MLRNILIKNNKWLKTKPHKLFHHLDRVTAWLNNEITPPIFVELGPTNACNQKCPWCYTSYTHGKLSFEKDLYLKIIKDLADFGVRSVCVQGTGEPFMNKYTPDAIELGSQLGIEMATITNGTLITEDVAKKVVPSLKWMKISAMESDSKIYSQNHGCSEKQYFQLLDNIKNIVAINKNINNSEFVLSAAMLVSENNWHTIEDVVKLCSELGFDFIQVRAPSGNLKIDYKTEADLHKKSEVDELIQKALQHQRKDFIVDIRIDSFEDQNQGPFKKNFTKCYGIEFESLIDADGLIYPCLRFWGDSDYAIGDLSKNSFKEIWTSKKKIEIFNKIYNECNLDKCYMVCKQSFINSDLEELKNPPLHKNFL